MTYAAQKPLPPMRAAKYTDGPNGCGYFTAGIDIPLYYDRFGDVVWHYHAIEFHRKSMREAERLRDMFLQRAGNE